MNLRPRHITPVFFLFSLVSFSSDVVDANTLATQITNAVLYGALGDALGAGIEMKSAQHIQKLDLTIFHERTGIFGRGHAQGFVTDDTWMSIGLMRAIRHHARWVDGTVAIEHEQILASYRQAYDDETQFIRKAGTLASTEEKGKWWGGIENVFTGKINYEQMLSAISSRSGDGNDQPGNGSLMRAPCLGFLPDKRDVKALARIDAEVTHPHPIAIDGSIALAMIMHSVVHEKKEPRTAIEAALSTVTNKHVDEYLRNLDELLGYADHESEYLSSGVLSQICEHEKNTLMKMGGNGIPGKALYTLGAVLYVLKYHDADTPLSRSLFRLLRMGGDVDSTASIGMAILGAYYGGTSSDDLADIGTLLLRIQPKNLIMATAKDYAEFIVGLGAKK